VPSVSDVGNKLVQAQEPRRGCNVGQKALSRFKSRGEATEPPGVLRENQWETKTEKRSETRCTVCVRTKIERARKIKAHTDCRALARLPEHETGDEPRRGKPNAETGGTSSPTEAGPRTARRLSEKETAAAGFPREAGPARRACRRRLSEEKTSGAIWDENQKSRESRNLAPSADQMNTETQHDEKNAHGGAHGED
jgi:hypothetical protein